MRVLVLGAGGPAGVNVCRALDAAGHDVVAADVEESHLCWAEPFAELLPAGDMSGDVDVVMAQPDSLALWLSDHRSEMPAALLPKPQTMVLCQDKFECGLQWRRTGLRDDRIHLVETLDDLWPAYPCWLRARHGAGAKAAIAARSFNEAVAWLAFWRERAADVDFVAEGFLPGRDYSWCGIYRDGELKASFARERLEYLYPHLTPEGLTGTPTRAVITCDPNVTSMARRAVLAVDLRPNGVFCVDLREDENGIPRPTEINAGRFSTTVGLWSLYSERSNFAALAAELAVGDESRLENWEDLPEGLTLSRHIDCGHVFAGVKVAA